MNFGMEMEPTVENLSEAFGFLVSPAFERAIRAAMARSPDEPHQGLKKFGLHLGGPLYSFLGGSAQSLRTPQMPPEFFPFAVRRGEINVAVGFLVDAPSLEGEPNTRFATCVPEHPERTGVVARNEQELFRWLGAHLDDLEGLGLPKESQVYRPEEVQAERDQSVSYRTADRLGVVTEEENAPLSLLHESLRSHLIESRNLERAQEEGRAALKVGAPGAALALARDITWWLGHREHWFELAIELYVGAYTKLERPLLTRIARREWVRFYGARSGES